MKIAGIILFLTGSLFSLCAYEVYGANVYPGAVNHQNTTLSYGMFSLNTMEGDPGGLKLTRTLAANNSTTVYEYGYDGQGRLTSFSETDRADGKDPVSAGTYGIGRAHV